MTTLDDVAADLTTAQGYLGQLPAVVSSVDVQFSTGVGTYAGMINQVSAIVNGGVTPLFTGLAATLQGNPSSTDVVGVAQQIETVNPQFGALQAAAVAIQTKADGLDAFHTGIGAAIQTALQPINDFLTAFWLTPGGGTPPSGKLLADAAALRAYAATMPAPFKPAGISPLPSQNPATKLATDTGAQPVTSAPSSTPVVVAGALGAGALIVLALRAAARK